MTFHFRDLHTAVLFWRIFDGTELDLCSLTVTTDAEDLTEKVLAHHVFTEVL